MRDILKYFLPPALASILTLVLPLSVLTQASQKTYQFVNGNWYDGTGFEKRSFFIVNGILETKRPSTVDETIDLKNQFVIPPFADAHTHNLDGTFNLEQTINNYIKEGTFYVQVLGNYAEGAKAARPFLNKPTSLDVIYANGMLTCTYGHPFMVYEPLAMGIYDPSERYRKITEIKKSRIAENRAYWFFDSKTDVDAKWQKYLATKPDVVKISLLDAENYQKYAAEGNTTDKGLSPEVAEYVVRKANQAGLRVYAHIETANDFRLGLKIGVDGFAHAPNYGWDAKENLMDDLTRADLKLAAKKGVVVIPTAKRGEFSVVESYQDGKMIFNQERRTKIINRHQKLFSEMARHGVKIAFGYDNFGQTLLPEIFYFAENKILDNRTILKIAVEQTPAAIFPNRKIGKLKRGYEASFITVEENPLKSLETLKKIKLRVKQGSFVELNPTPGR